MRPAAPQLPPRLPSPSPSPGPLLQVTHSIKTEAGEKSMQIAMSLFSPHPPSLPNSLADMLQAQKQTQRQQPALPVPTVTEGLSYLLACKVVLLL